MLCYTYNYTFRSILEVNIMPRSRPASNPISYHKHTRQYYVTRGGRRTYLGSDKDQALEKYHRLGLGLDPSEGCPLQLPDITVKELANEGDGATMKVTCLLQDITAHGAKMRLLSSFASYVREQRFLAMAFKVLKINSFPKM